MNLLYRASEHEFKIFDFHRFCDDIPNTLILIKTEFEKIIGAYTPISWESISDKTNNIGKGKRANEETNSSFLFSLTNRDKFVLDICNPKYV